MVAALQRMTSLDQPQNQTGAEVAADIALGFTPLAVPQSARDFERSRRQGDKLGMLLAGVGMVPVVGGLVKGGKTAIKTIDKAIEGRYFDRLAKDYEGLKAAYAAIPETKGGKVLNTDTARELSPDYLADRTRSADVHEPSSAFIKRVFAERMAQPTPPGKEPVVVFTAGGTGAGKTSGLKGLREADPRIDRAELEYDTNMNKFSSAKEKVDQVLKSGRRAQVFFTYRNPVESLDQGALTRAMDQEAQFGTGRTVPITEHLNTHIGSRDVMEKLQKEYGDNPNFRLVVIDNSRGRGNAVVSSLDKLPKLDENKVRDELRQTLEKARAEKRISEKVYRGFAAY
jgi:hypothetical protein